MVNLLYNVNRDQEYLNNQSCFPTRILCDLPKDNLSKPCNKNQPHAGESTDTHCLFCFFRKSYSLVAIRELIYTARCDCTKEISKGRKGRKSPNLTSPAHQESMNHEEALTPHKEKTIAPA
jgi:hypothetical protein